MQFPTLYKTDSKGKIRQWDIEVNELGAQATIIVTHGLRDGAKVVKTTTIATGKNIGKSNETTCFQQAESEAKSKWEKQVDDGYTPDANVQSAVVLPMLAQRFDQHGHKIIYPAYAQPKLDGIRCLGFRNSLSSRKGKPINSLPHIQEEVSGITDFIDFSEFGGIGFLDGELYSRKLSFQEITSIVRKQDPPDNYNEIEFHVYDICFNHKHVTFAERYQALKNLKGKHKYIKIVETVPVMDRSELAGYASACVKNGYEGGIVRNAHGLYELDKRSYDLQKIKTFQDAEFKILAGREDKDGGVVFTCEYNGTEFDVRPEGTVAERAKYLADINFIIGKDLTVRYFEMTTSDKPVPRFPVGVTIRDYE